MLVFLQKTFCDLLYYVTAVAALCCLVAKVVKSAVPLTVFGHLSHLHLILFMASLIVDMNWKYGCGLSVILHPSGQAEWLENRDLFHAH